MKRNPFIVRSMGVLLCAALLLAQTRDAWAVSPNRATIRAAGCVRLFQTQALAPSLLNFIRPAARLGKAEEVRLEEIFIIAIEPMSLAEAEQISESADDLQLFSRAWWVPIQLPDPAVEPHRERLKQWFRGRAMDFLWSFVPYVPARAGRSEGGALADFAASVLICPPAIIESAKAYRIRTRMLPALFVIGVDRWMAMAYFRAMLNMAIVLGTYELNVAFSLRARWLRLRDDAALFAGRVPALADDLSVRIARRKLDELRRERILLIRSSFAGSRRNARRIAGPLDSEVENLLTASRRLIPYFTAWNRLRRSTRELDRWMPVKTASGEGSLDSALRNSLWRRLAREFSGLPPWTTMSSALALFPTLEHRFRTEWQNMRRDIVDTLARNMTPYADIQSGYERLSNVALPVPAMQHEPSMAFELGSVTRLLRHGRILLESLLAPAGSGTPFYTVVERRVLLARVARTNLHIYLNPPLAETARYTGHDFMEFQKSVSMRRKSLQAIETVFSVSNEVAEELAISAAFLFLMALPSLPRQLQLFGNVLVGMVLGTIILPAAVRSSESHDLALAS